MKPRSLRSVLLPLAAGLFQFLSGCMSSTVNDPDKSAGGSDEIDTRVAVDRTGRPVASARIALVRTDDSTGKPVAVNATGTDGSFPKFVVPDGFYSVVLRDPGDSLGKYVDSVQVMNQKVPAGRDTLLALGSVSGVVRVSAGHSPVTVSMGLVGTDILATVKTDGTFRIELVPGGIYTLGAFPMLEGYGPLYLRLQLKNGQNLTLPDTLVMPFTGLPAPGALRVLQDTGTGNLRLSWSRVDHPDLLGYFLERVEGGVVTTSRYLTDTAWTDSLGANWEAMPLLGPWPSREVAYRVRARSLSGSPDSKSAAQAITAKPPEWTKRVDSVKVAMQTDSASGVTMLRWTPLVHPDLIGWRVSRQTNGVDDCSETTQDSFWGDSKCADPRRTRLDSMVDQNGVVISLLNGRALRCTYSVMAKRKIGNSISLLGGSRELAKSMVEWRDSVPTKTITNMASHGGWVLINDRSISHDGNSWEDLPDEYSRMNQYWWTAQGDSVWFGKLNADSIHLSIFSRISKGTWKQFTVELPSKWFRIVSFAAIGNRLLVSGFDPTGEESVLLIDSNQVQPILFGNDGKFSSWGAWELVEPLANGWRFDILSKDRTDKEASVYLMSPDSVVFSRMLRSERGLIGNYKPIGNKGGFVNRSGDGSALDYYDIRSNYGYRLNVPVSNGDQHSHLFEIATMNGEIWTIIDGRLWKGKLNLPASSPVEKP